MISDLNASFIQSLDNFSLQPCLSGFLQVSSIAVDSIAHYLYWSETVFSESTSKKSSSIHQVTRIRRISLQSEMNNHEPITILNLEDNIMIGKMFIGAGPYNSRLYLTSRSNMNDLGYKLNVLNLSQFGKTLAENLENNLIQRAVEKNLNAGNCNCQNVFKTGTVHPKFSIFQGEEGLQNFLLIAAKENNCYAADENFCNCEKFETTISGNIDEVMTLSSTAIFHSSEYKLISYSLSSLKGYSTPSFRSTSLSNTHDLDVFDPLSIKIQQAILPKSCVEPETILQSHNDFKVFQVLPNSLQISVPKVESNSNCSNMMPQTIFSISYMLSSQPNANFDDFNRFEVVTRTFSVDPSEYSDDSDISSLPTVTLSGLKSFSTYRFHITAKNGNRNVRFIKLDPLSNDHHSHDVIELVARTAEGKPSEPRNVSVVVLSPEAALVRWLPSLTTNGNHIQYMIRWSYLSYGDESEFSEAVSFPEAHLNVSEQNTEDYLYHVIGLGENHLNLLPDQAYKLSVTARTKFPEESRSKESVFKTFQRPNLVTIPKEHLKPRSMHVEWLSPKDDNVVKHEIKIMPLEEFNNVFVGQENPFSIDTYNEAGSTILGFKSLSTNLTQPSQKYSYDFTDLSPGTDYVVFVQLTYELDTPIPYRSLDSSISVSGDRLKHFEYQWPHDNRHVVSTPPDKPLTPGPPYDEIVDGIPYLR